MNEGRGSDLWNEILMLCGLGAILLLALALAFGVVRWGWQVAFTG